MPGRTIYCRYS